MNPVRIVTVLGVGLFVAVVIVLLARNCRDTLGIEGVGVVRGKANAEVVGPFYIGVSSLDVEENERAARLFESLSSQISNEPAVWANLGIARMRLGALAEAETALDRAVELAPRNESIILLRAILDELRGEFDRAIGRLRGLRSPDPAALYRLAELLGRTGREADAREQLQVYDRIRELNRGNLVAQFGRARLLARMEDGPRLAEALAELETHRGNWDETAVQQFESARTAANGGNFRAAATHLAFLQNLNLPTPAYQAALGELGVEGGSIGQPIPEFLHHATPEVVVAEPDTGLRWEVVSADIQISEGEFLSAVRLGTNSQPNLVAFGSNTLRIPNVADLETGSAGNAGPHALAVFDLNGDFLMDLGWAGSAGLRIWKQTANGEFSELTLGGDGQGTLHGTRGVWSLDFEADGDMDLVVAREDAPPLVMRNNGDETFTLLDALVSFPSIRELCWADFDGDGDGDLAMLDANRRVLVSWNNRAGSFAEPIRVIEAPGVAITHGDPSATGSMNLLILEENGTLSECRFDRGTANWTRTELMQWSNPGPSEGWVEQRIAVAVGDLDNNGAVDIVASAGTNCAVWLNSGSGRWQRVESTPGLLVTSLVDVNGDGLLDLVGVSPEGGLIGQGRGTRSYHWQSIHTRTLANVADGRLNSFGIGGRIDVRAGPLLAAMPITSSHTHFGLGVHQEVGVARITWPNGVAQVEFDLRSDQVVLAVQRLKGSCPWVFAGNDRGFTFVKDFIWRSPLGMRINSQDTAGVDQTEDWILIPGALLTPREGAYEIRITAELWETHFFDHIALMAIDHPADVAVHVDERFVPTHQPKLEVIATSHPRPMAQARDEAGQDVLDSLSTTDGHYVDGFILGRFQGIAEDHWVEFELPADAPADRSLVLIGEGWIYPTDSSLNVAISQGKHPAPRGLSMEEWDPAAGWRVVSGDLGFPAGKNKTVVIPFPPESLQAGRRRFRLRTNLEVYWDRLAWAEALPAAAMKVTRPETLVADLRHRGFSALPAPERRRPDLPVYERFAGPGPRWRDLEGFYTRHGDVRELLAEVDDRYVIMNAGDEFVLRFEVPSEPVPEGWVRDFVLVGDGWVKDGDFNTANSRTVHPLPAHGVSEYPSEPRRLEDDPVFQRHIDDWRRFHTRFVTAAAFDRGLMTSRSRNQVQMGGSR